jgi:hypothetical protein
VDLGRAGFDSPNLARPKNLGISEFECADCEPAVEPTILTKRPSAVHTRSRDQAERTRKGVIVDRSGGIKPEQCFDHEAWSCEQHDRRLADRSSVPGRMAKMLDRLEHSLWSSRLFPRSASNVAPTMWFVSWPGRPTGENVENARSRYIAWVTAGLNSRAFATSVRSDRFTENMKPSSVGQSSVEYRKQLSRRSSMVVGW